MKAEVASRAGVIDAIASGLGVAVRRPLLLIIPAAIDLGLWLAPQLSIAGLLERLRLAWEALLASAYSSEQLAAMGDALEAIRVGLQAAGKGVNLATAITGGWLAPPSVMASAQATRFRLISDLALAPTGFGLSLPDVAAWPGRPPAVEIDSAVLAVLIVFGLWCAGLILTTAYMRLVAGSSAVCADAAEPAGPETAPQASAPRFGILLLRFAGLSLLLTLLLFVLRTPLALAAALSTLGGGALCSAGLMLVLLVTLWLVLQLLSSVFLVSEAMLLDGQPFLQALWRSLHLVRRSGARTLGLIVVVNLLVLGLRALSGIVGQAPIGAILAIIANAYLATALLLAVFIYYRGLRREWQADRAPVRVET